MNSSLLSVAALAVTLTNVIGCAGCSKEPIAAAAPPPMQMPQFGAQQQQQPYGPMPQGPMPQGPGPAPGQSAYDGGGMPQGPTQMPMQNPNPQGYGPPSPQGPGSNGAQNNGSLAQLGQWERQDMRVQAEDRLHNGEMHGPTPNSIPGGQVVTTQGLIALLQGAGGPVVLLDVLGAPQRIPGSLYAVPASQPGDFNDQAQQQFGQFLQGAVAGKRGTSIITYCQGPQCWMSYNAALRAIHLGYKNVMWYRGGLEAWGRAGQRMDGQGQTPQPQPQYRSDGEPQFQPGAQPQYQPEGQPQPMQQPAPNGVPPPQGGNDPWR
jgi:PQQ-dependent catabolism-associated CXXCW motif protein